MKIKLDVEQKSGGPYIMARCAECNELVVSTPVGSDVVVNGTSWGGLEWEDPDGFEGEHTCPDAEE